MSAEQDFEDLRRLLALKRHERPPPGYFQDFSGQVIARIHAGEAASSRSWTHRVLAGAPWLQNLWDGFGAKPMVAGAFGVSVCSLLVVGLISSERVDSNAAGLPGDNGDRPPLLANMPRQQPFGTSIYERSAGDYSYTGAVFRAQQPRSIFEELHTPHVERMSFSP